MSLMPPSFRFLPMGLKYVANTQTKRALVPLCWIPLLADHSVLAPHCHVYEGRVVGEVTSEQWVPFRKEQAEWENRKDFTLSPRHRSPKTLFK